MSRLKGPQTFAFDLANHEKEIENERGNQFWKNIAVVSLEKNPVIPLMKSSHATFLFLHSAWHMEVTQHTFAELCYHKWKYMSNNYLEDP